jgi:hypothetical protein
MFYLGIDIGKSQDHTAIAIVERADAHLVWLNPEFDHLTLRYAERVPLGTHYPQVVENVRHIVTHEQLRGQCAITVNATGVGAPVVDMLRAAGLACDIAAVTITGGERTASSSGNIWSVPKMDLLAGVQVLLQKRELKIAPDLPEAAALGPRADRRENVGRASRLCPNGRRWIRRARRSRDRAGLGLLARDAPPQQLSWLPVNLQIKELTILQILTTRRETRRL